MKLCLNILAIISILVVVCVVIICVISYIENRKLVVTDYVIRAGKLPEVFDGYRIVQLSDLHNACFGENNGVLLNKVRNCKPDVIFVTGDMIVGKPGQDVLFAADTMNALCDIAPVYFSMGNHELRASIYTETYGDMWQQFRNRLRPEIHVLLNQTAKIMRGQEYMCVHGVNLTPALYKRMIRTPMEPDYLDNIFGTCDASQYHIFLAHNPDYFEEYVSWGADLTFAGHVHGGMIRIPLLGGALSPMIHFFPKYDKGVFEYQGRYMILSGGIGNHTFKFRVNNLPEIIVATLIREP